MEQSAGAVIQNNKGHYLVIQGRQGHWGFPKGHLEENETVEEAAIREVKEEVCLDIELTSISETLEYVMDDDKKKQVTFFLANTKSERIQHNAEIIAHAWLSKEEILKRLSFDDLKEVFKKLLDKDNKEKDFR